VNFSCNDTGQHFQDTTERVAKHGKEDPSEADMQRRVISWDENTWKCKVYWFGEQRNSPEGVWMLPGISCYSTACRAWRWR